MSSPIDSPIISSRVIDLSCIAKAGARPATYTGLTRSRTKGFQSTSSSTKESEFIVKSISIPVTTEKNVQTRVEGDTLIVSAVLTEGDQMDNEQYQYTGRPLRSTKSVHNIPEEFDHENVKAKFENGVLRLTFPRKASTE
jgi:HSP20 family molecular chaperone IbpA